MSLGVECESLGTHTTSSTLCFMLAVEDVSLSILFLLACLLIPQRHGLPSLSTCKPRQTLSSVSCSGMVLCRNNLKCNSAGP